ncbi:MAG: cation:proton antiporter [Candidatus Omnitrophica bacterium]|nr:cation:proton antiporter [Candidatus Omnitrophota bacterium]
MLIQLIIFSLAAVIFVPIFTRLGLGPILAYLFSGVLVGPHVLGLIKDPVAILHFSELGVVFLLFIIGLELAPAKLWTMRHAIFGYGLLQVLLTGFLLMGLGRLLGLNVPAAFAAGFGLAMSSTAFAAQLMEANRQLNTRHGQGAFAILMFQDIAVVPILALMSLDTGNSFTLLGFVNVLAVLTGVVIVGNYLMRPVFRLVADTKIQEVFIAMSLIIVLGTALLFEAIGLSMGMGAFMAGILLTNSEYRHELVASLGPFKGLLLGLFFIAVGMSLDLNVIASKPWVVLLVTAGFMFLKGLIVFALGRLFRYDRESARNIAFTIPQGGEFAFVLFSVALTKKFFIPQTAAILNAAITISMGLTPLVFAFNQRYLRKSSEISERPYDVIDESAPEVIIAGFGRFGQIVARLLKSDEIGYVILDNDAGQVDVARRFGSKVYYGDASRMDILESAGTAKAKHFVLAVDDVQKSLEIAQNVKRHFPNVEIIARARNRQHALSLMELGIESIHRETYLSSLEAAKEVLIKKGANPQHIKRRIDLFRLHDEKILKEQFLHRNDEKKFVSYTTQANAELEQILKADRENPSS